MLNPRDILRAAFRTGGGSPTPTTTAVLVPGAPTAEGDSGLFSDVDSRIIVCVRVRPPPAGERPIVTVRDADDHVFVEDPTSSATAGADPLRVGRSRERAFAFDVSCGAAATTAHVYVTLPAAACYYDAPRARLPLTRSSQVRAHRSAARLWRAGRDQLDGLRVRPNGRGQDPHHDWR